MGSLHNFRSHKHVSLLENVGEKAKNIVELVGAIKGVYDAGKMVYTGLAVAAPYLMMAGL